MKWMADNWSMIVAAVAAIAITTMRILRYMRMTKEEQEETIRKHKEALTRAVTEWALKGITEAEKDFGAGTGKLKIRAVYEKAIELFGAEIAEIMTIDQFNVIIQKPLAEMRKMLEDNTSAREYVEGGK